MATPQVLWLLVTIGMIKTTLTQSDDDMAFTEKMVTSSKNLIVDTTELNNEIKTTFSDSESISEEAEINKNINYQINLEDKASNEIDLKNNSSERRPVKRSTITAESTKPSSTVVSTTETMLHIRGDDSHEKSTSYNEMVKDFVSTDTSDFLLQSQGSSSRELPSVKFPEIRDDRNGGIASDAAEEVSNDSMFGKTTSSFSELSETKPSITEISELKPAENIRFPDGYIDIDSVKAATPFTESFTVNSTDSHFSDTEEGRSASDGLVASATEFSTAGSLETDYSEVEILNMGDLTKEEQELKTESVQTRPMSEISVPSLAATRGPDLIVHDSKEKASQSQDSKSTTAEDTTYASDRTIKGDNIYRSTIGTEATKEQSVTKKLITYSFEEENHRKDDVAEIGSSASEAEHKTETAESFTVENITEERTVDEPFKTTADSNKKQQSDSTEISTHEGSYFASEETITDLQEGREDITLSSSEISKSTDIAPDSENNSTRIPKRIQEPRYTETRYRPRPARPDPGYSYSDDSDSIQPYRPDDLLYSRGQKPVADSHTPLRREPDFSRPARPDPYVPADDFPRHVPDYSRQSSSDSGVPKPYRPQTSFARPYIPQGSFGRPYRPDRDQSKHVPPGEFHSKTTQDLPASSKPDVGFFGASQPATDFSQSSHAVDYDSKTSASSEFEHRRPHSDVKPIVLTPDVFRPYRPTLDEKSSLDRERDLPRPPRPVYLPPSSTVTASDTSKSATPEFGSKPASKQDADEDISSVASSVQGTRSGDKSKPSGSYPRPGFGSNYGQSTGTSPKPFTPGTISLARNNLTRVEYIKADCFDNHMKVSIRFNGSFNGLVYSSGYSQDSTCSYINGSGRYHYEFFIRLNRCGTLGQQEVADQRVDTVTRRRQDRAQYLVNTVTVQYNPVIEEEIDEHFRVTCEYGYDFWKTVTFPVVSVESSAMKVRTGSPVVFTLPPPQCNMEIRTGYGPSGSRVSGPVNVGDPLTLVIHMKSESAGFDILVSNCLAHNGAQKRLQLIDSNGCVVQEKLISPFRGVSSPDRSQQVTLYSYLKAFRFTGSPALYIECDVHMCHGSCPPQRCYWRHLYKRSVENVTAISTEDPLISESVSLFQSLEVRNEESDRPNSLAVSSSDGHSDEDMVCFRSAGFAAILACLLICLTLTCLTSICLCSRMRKMKTYFESLDTKQFLQSDNKTHRK